MPKDYRKRTASRRRSNSNLSWVIFGVLIGVVLAVAFFWNHNAPHHTLATHPISKASTHTTVTVAAKKSAATTPEFDFYTVLPNMQVTPNTPAKPAPAPVVPTAAAPAAVITTPPATNAVPTTTSAVNTSPATPPAATIVEAKPATTTPSKPAPAAAAPTTADVAANEPTNYLLQMASLKNYADADRMKAQLTMQGFDVYIQSFNVNGQTFNRIVMGPYSSKQTALQQQAQLQKHHIASILIKAS